MKRKNIVCIAMATTLSCTPIINSASSITHAEEAPNNLKEASNKLSYTKFTSEFKNGEEKVADEIKISVESIDESKIEKTKNGKIELDIDTSKQPYKIKVADEDENWTSETYNIFFFDSDDSRKFDEPEYKTYYTNGEFSSDRSQDVPSKDQHSEVELKDFDGSISIMKKIKKTEESEKSKENTDKQKVEDKQKTLDNPKVEGKQKSENQQKSEIEKVAEEARKFLDPLEKLKKETHNFELLGGLSDSQLAGQKSDDGTFEPYMKYYTDKETFEKHIENSITKNNLNLLKEIKKQLRDISVVGQFMLNHRHLYELSKEYPEDDEIKALLKNIEIEFKGKSLDGSNTDVLAQVCEYSKQKLDEAKKIVEKKKQEEQKKKESEEQQRREEQKKKELEEQQRKKALEDQKKKDLEEQQKKKVQEEQQKKTLEEQQRKKALEDQKKKDLEEQQRKKALENQKKKDLEEQQKKKVQEEQQKKKDLEEQQKKKVQEEQQKKKDLEEQQKKKDLEEQQKKKALEEQQKKKPLEEQKKKDLEEQQRKKPLEEQKKKDLEEQQKKKVQEEQQKKTLEEQQRKKPLEDQKKKALEEQQKKKPLEDQKKKDLEKEQQNDKNKINTKYIRIAGQDRIETSVQISKSKFKSSDTVIIASANNFPDALSASSLASLYKAPILLSNKDSISKSVIDEVSRLGAKNIIVVGGENSISENALSSLNKLKVERISGNNRYETSKKISERVIEKGYNKSLILVDGRNYPDALAASSLVAKNNGPILLVSDSNNEAKNNVEFAKSLKPSYTLIIGGINSVSKNIENELKNPTRISGSDRYETSKKVANAILSKNSDIYVTTGRNYADAISSGPAVILDKAALILVDDNNSDIKDIKTKFTPSTINVIGGLNSISDILLSKIK